MDHLKVVESDGRVEIRRGAAPVLEGLSVFGRMEAGFVPSSGVRSAFLLTGRSGESGFTIAGRGAMSIHGLEVPSAAVTASHEGVLVESGAVWAGEPRPIRFQLDEEGAVWRGRAMFEEALPCSVTPALHLNVVVEIEAGPSAVIVRAAAEAEGLRGDAEITAERGSELGACMAEARGGLLAALEERARERVEALEDAFMEREGGLRLAIAKPAPPPSAAPAPHPLPVGPGYRPPVGGYLPAKGYLSNPVALPGGYLGPGAGGYLPGRGYLPLRAEPVAIAIPEESPPAAADSQDSETAVSSILRWKDALYALSAAREGSR